MAGALLKWPSPGVLASSVPCSASTGSASLVLSCRGLDGFPSTCGLLPGDRRNRAHLEDWALSCRTGLGSFHLGKPSSLMLAAVPRAGLLPCCSVPNRPVESCKKPEKGFRLAGPSALTLLLST